MEKKKNRPPKLEIMTLGFFARYFNFPVKSLAWGIVEVSPSIGTDYIKCAVLVKNKPLYIDIVNAKIRAGFSSRIKLFFCETEDTDEEFVFISKVHNGRFIINKESIQACYADRVYSFATDWHLLGGFADLGAPRIHDANVLPD
jgi:hypothetical protein